MFIPFLTVLAYLVFRGRSMAGRQIESRMRAEDGAAAYVQQLAGTSPADEITKASQLLASNTITPAEFNTLKARALG